MKKSLLFLVALLATALVSSCNKDSLYAVDDYTSTNNISSIIIVSSNYTLGIPAIEMNNRYKYEYTYSDAPTTPTTGSFISNNAYGVPNITVKINSSKASLSGVKWMILKRPAKLASASTKAVESEVVFDGKISATRSKSDREVVTLTLENDSNNISFFEPNGYVYSVVAQQSDGSQITSDVACLIEGKEIQLLDVIMGCEVNGIVVNYEESFEMEADKVTFDKPQLYGVLEQGDSGEISKALTFEEMGFDKSQYKFYLKSLPGAETETLTAKVLKSEDAQEPFASSTQWEIGIHDRFKGYHYNEFNGEIGLEFCLEDGAGRVIEPSMCSYFYSVLDNVELTSSASVENMTTPFYTPVFNKFFTTNKLLDRVMGRSYPNSSDSQGFVDSFCNSSAVITLDGQASADITLDSSDEDEIKIKIDKKLADGKHTIKVSLTSSQIQTTVSQTITLTVSSK